MTAPTGAQLATARRQRREMAEMLRGIWRDGTFGDVADRVLSLLAEREVENGRLTALLDAQRVAFEQVARERDDLKAEREKYDTPIQQANDRLNGRVDLSCTILDMIDSSATLRRLGLGGQKDVEFVGRSELMAAHDAISAYRIWKTNSEEVARDFLAGSDSVALTPGAAHAP